MRVLGCDPGLTGALCLVDTTTGEVVVVDAPTVTVTLSNRKERDEIDAPALAALVRSLRPDVAIVELVGAAPGQGVTSMFRFGHVTGVLKGVLAALDVPTTTVPPQAWRRVARLSGGKDEARARAGEIFPSLAPSLRLKKHHGRADAALIAFFGVWTLDTPF